MVLLTFDEENSLDTKPTSRLILLAKVFLNMKLTRPLYTAGQTAILFQLNLVRVADTSLIN